MNAGRLLSSTDRNKKKSNRAEQEITVTGHESVIKTCSRAQ